MLFGLICCMTPYRRYLHWISAIAVLLAMLLLMSSLLMRYGRSK